MKNQKYYIENLQVILKRLKLQFRIKSAYIFGSIARNDFDENSDLDLLIDFTTIPSLFKISDLQIILKNELSIEVDIADYDKRRMDFISSLADDLIKIEI